MNICIYTYIHAYIHTYIHTNIHTYLYTNTCIKYIRQNEHLGKSYRTGSKNIGSRSAIEHPLNHNNTDAQKISLIR